MNICNENNVNNDNNMGDEEDIIDIKDMFMLLLDYIIKTQSNNHKKLNNGNLQKKISLMGGVSNVESLQNSLKDSFNDTLYQTGEHIHKLIHKHKADIYNHQICKTDIDNVIAIINNDPTHNLYTNVNISFKFMMTTIGNIFNYVFLNILPRISMMNSLYAVLYQAAFLNELDVLQHYSKIIQLPLMYRLIYSFYKDERQPPPQTEKIRRLVDRLCRSRNDKDIDTICEIAIKLDLQNLEELNSIYWLLSDKRKFTYEFYIIIIIGLYVVGKCRGINKENVKLNAKLFENLFMSYYMISVNTLLTI